MEKYQETQRALHWYLRMNKNPLVSILINNYNKEKYCAKSVQSVISQDYKKIEIIFYDDGSSDLSLKKILNLKKKYPKKIKIIQNNNRGKIYSFNQIDAIKKSISKSKGKIICILDSDDWFKKNKIKKVVNFFKKNKKQEILFDRPIYSYENNNFKKSKLDYKKRYDKWPCFPPTSCISLRKKSLKKIIHKISNKKFPDLWFDFRIASFFAIKKGQFNILNEYLTFYRQTSDSFEKNYNKFVNFSWWKRRNQAFNFILLLDRKNYNKYKSLDFFITKLVYRIFSIF